MGGAVSAMLLPLLVAMLMLMVFGLLGKENFNFGMTERKNSSWIGNDVCE